MNGYGSHTFKWINKEGKAHWMKFHFISDQGIKNLTHERAVELAGINPDYILLKISSRTFRMATVRHGHSRCRLCRLRTRPRTAGIHSIWPRYVLIDAHVMLQKFAMCGGEAHMNAVELTLVCAWHRCGFTRITRYARWESWSWTETRPTTLLRLSNRHSRLHTWFLELKPHQTVCSRLVSSLTMMRHDIALGRITCRWELLLRLGNWKLGWSF